MASLRKASKSGQWTAAGSLAAALGSGRVCVECMNESSRVVWYQGPAHMTHVHASVVHSWSEMVGAAWGLALW